jgi:hypothetical protein
MGISWALPMAVRMEAAFWVVFLRIRSVRDLRTVRVTHLRDAFPQAVEIPRRRKAGW